MASTIRNHCLRLDSKEQQEVSDTELTQMWNELESKPPLGLVNIPREMARIANKSLSILESLQKVQKALSCIISTELLDRGVSLIPCSHPMQQNEAEVLYGKLNGEYSVNQGKKCPHCETSVRGYVIDKKIRNLIQGLSKILDNRSAESSSHIPDFTSLTEQQIQDLRTEIECPVLFEDMVEGVILTPCAHRVQKLAAETIMRDTAEDKIPACPECRTVITEFIDDRTIRVVSELLPKILDQCALALKSPQLKIPSNDQMPSVSPLHHFKELASRFIQVGATITGTLPITISDFEDLQFQAKRAQDEALLSIWPRITLFAMKPALQTAEAIRAWLNDLNNAPYLNQVTMLDLSGLKLTVLPLEITRFIYLQWLELDNNQLTSLPEDIGALSQLEWLNLSRNKITSLPDTVLKLQIKTKRMHDEALLAILPIIEAKLEKKLQLHKADDIREWLNDPKNAASLSKIKRLSLSELQLKVFPPEIARFTHLQVLDLSFNQLISLPAEISALTQLQGLYLNNNQITLLPNAICALAQLRVLYLNNNDLGSLPDKFTDLTLLRDLRLDHNKLRRLPAAFEALTQLQFLHLYKNQLDSLPDSIAALPRLQTLVLQDGPPLMFIPDGVLNSNLSCISGNSTVKNYRQELAHQSTSSLAKLYQSIMNRKSVAEIKILFSSLSKADKKLIFKSIRLCAGSPQVSDQNWGEHHVFDDMSRFYLSVGASVRMKWNGLPQDQKKQVYEQLFHISNVTNADMKLNTALNNMPLIADGMAALENPPQARQVSFLRGLWDLINGR